MSYSKRRDSKGRILFVGETQEKSDDINTGIAMVLVVEGLFIVGD